MRYADMVPRFTLLCVGKLKQPWAADACEQFVLRLGPQLELRQLPSSKQTHPEKQKEEECARLLDALEQEQGTAWVLDERGKAMTSTAFAADIGKARDAGEHLVFVLGGAYGLTDAVRARGRRMLRLSDMVLPHELCRVVFLEQLYRAQEILKGSGYHH